MKKGLILIMFAWAVEVIGVTAGLVNAVHTTYPNGKLPESWWLWLAILPWACWLWPSSAASRSPPLDDLLDGHVAEDKDGPGPATIVKEEVVKWIDRIVLIPRWGLRAPIYVNSLIKDEPNVAALKRAN
jgi:hypothetical protein